MKTALWIALISLLIVGCSDSGPPVHFIVEDSFHGEIIIKPDKKAGSIPQFDDHYKIVIPASGKMSFQNLDPLRQWHSVIPKRKNSERIPWPGHVDHNTVSWHSGTTSSEGVTRYFVGTLKEYYEYRGWTDRVKELEENEPVALP
ncbi:MAG: hypothetical protein AAF546_12415 [Verrucomicrobiota bacterium]